MKEILTKLDELKSMVQALDAAEDKKDGWAQEGVKYYYPAMIKGEVSPCENTFRGTIGDEFHLSLGLAFRTKEECQKWIDKQKLLTEISKEPGFDKKGRHGWSYRKRINGWELSFFARRQHFMEVAFKTADDARRALEKYKDRLDILLD